MLKAVPQNDAGFCWTPPFKKRLAGRLKVIKPFDPYNSPLCTCPPKLTLNVYTGCGFDCFYCYTSSYAWGRWGRDSQLWGPRKNLLMGLDKDINALKQAGLDRLPVVLSLSSDPYPDSPMVKESELELTRTCLARLTQAGMPVHIQTKSDLFVRDLDLLDPATALIGMTITTASEHLAAQMEPFAPPPSARIAALGRAARAGFRTICRIDPLVPGINDRRDDLAKLVERLRDAGVRQVISSTFKKRWDSSRRFQQIFPESAAASANQYETTQIQGYHYLKENVRREMLATLQEIVHASGMQFSTCREGLTDLNDCCCDGRRAGETTAAFTIDAADGNDSADKVKDDA